MKAAALRGALSDRARHGRVQVVTGFVDGDAPRTKDALAVLAAATGTGRGASLLVVLRRDDELARKSLRNAAGVQVITQDQLNTYDVLAADHVVFTAEALEAFVNRGTRSEEAAQ
jgi:large subunit ribosomal protein L4